jgi:sec-independent protein translocase protein TatA
MGIPAPTELLLILGIVMIVFGGKRIPEIMGGVGQGIKALKKSLEDDPATPSQQATAGEHDPAQAKKG